MGLVWKTVNKTDNRRLQFATQPWNCMGLTECILTNNITSALILQYMARYIYKSADLISSPTNHWEETYAPVYRHLTTAKI